MHLEPEAQESGSDWASCGIRKDGGDDHDVTNGALIVATVRRTQSGIHIDGGQGVGRVTRPGRLRYGGDHLRIGGPVLGGKDL